MATQHSPSGMTAMQQIDSRPLTKNQKNLIGLAVAGNISEFFDMFLIGFAVASLLKDPNWNPHRRRSGHHPGHVRFWHHDRRDHVGPLGGQAPSSHLPFGVTLTPRLLGCLDDLKVLLIVFGVVVFALVMGEFIVELGEFILVGSILRGFLRLKNKCR